MFRRRPLMRAAVIGGGAYVAGKHVANKSAQQADYQAEQDQRISDLEQQQPAPPPAAAGGTGRGTCGCRAIHA